MHDMNLSGGYIFWYPLHVSNTPGINYEYNTTIGQSGDHYIVLFHSAVTGRYISQSEPRKIWYILDIDLIFHVCIYK